MILYRTFVCYVHWLGWQYINLGLSVDIEKINIEIHLPFCFFRIGWDGMRTEHHCRAWGYNTDTVRQRAFAGK